MGELGDLGELARELLLQDRKLFRLSRSLFGEVPQIISNFRNKSSRGVSFVFLLTWIAGDALNLVGCLLEPSTLPTQYYTAVLYTTSTVILVMQSLYYDHVYHWWKARKTNANPQLEEVTAPLLDVSSSPVTGARTIRSSPARDFFYASARSLAASVTPPDRTYLRANIIGPVSVTSLENDSTTDIEPPAQIPSARSVTLPKPIPHSAAAYGAFLATATILPQETRAVTRMCIGRRLLQERSGESGPCGQLLGWVMAAIYMGGRVPQIVLNTKRGSVEGLNPLMFIFALAANSAYVGSILVRSTEWEKIKANMPWLFDAVGCVALDLFIMFQYIYYRYIRKKKSNGGEDF